MLGLAQLAFWACVSSDSPEGGEGLKPYKEENSKINTIKSTKYLAFSVKKNHI